MYQQGDKMLEVRELLVKAFATAWKNSDQSTDRDTYINSSITVIDSMQVQPEMIYAEEGQGLTDGEELDHLADLVRARVPQPDIIEHFGNADAVPQPPERCLSRQAGIARCCLINI